MGTLKNFFGWLLFCIPCISIAQVCPTSLGATAHGLGNVNTCTEDAWSVFNNPGGLAASREITIASTYKLLPAASGFNQMAALVTLPEGESISFGLGLFSTGDKLYNEQSIALAVGHRMGHTSLGLRTNLLQFSAEGFGSRTALSISCGGITQITQRLSIGAYIHHLNQPHFTEAKDQRIPAVMALGLSFKTTDQTTLFAELEKDVRYNPLWRLGMEYRPVRALTVRSGVNLYPGHFFLGLGLHHRQLNMDYAMQYGSAVGLLHQLSLTLSLPEK
jgi:hypothetical protein